LGSDHNYLNSYDSIIGFFDSGEDDMQQQTDSPQVNIQKQAGSFWLLLLQTNKSEFRRQ
jgi:hypothetical protein